MSKKHNASLQQQRSTTTNGSTKQRTHAIPIDLHATEALQRRLNQLHALYQLTAALSRASALEEIYDAALEGLHHALGIERASILLFDPDGVMRFKAWRGLSDHYRHATEGHTPWSLATKNPSPVLVADVNTDPTLVELRPIIHDEGIQALAFVPLVHQGSLLGKFMLYYPTPHHFTDEEIQIARSIGSHIAVAVARRQAEQAIATARIEATIAAERAAFLAELSRVLATTLDYTQTLTNLARASVPFLADACVIYQLVPPSTLRRYVLAHVDAEIETLLREVQRFEIPLESDIPVARAVRSGRLEVEYQVAGTIGERVHLDPTYQAIVRRLAPHAYICVPLIAHGRTLGAVAFILTEPDRQYIATDVELATEVAQRAALALDNAHLYQQAQDAIVIRDQFLSTAAHELKTPLTALLGTIQVMERRAQREGSLPERERRTLDVIHAQTQRLNKMVATLLDITRFEQGKLTIEPAPLDLCAMISRIVEEVLLGLTTHTVGSILPETAIFIDADELRLEQVVQNLLSNAVKYSPSGGAIQVRVGQRENTVCIEVTDQGIGIPAKDIPHLFEHFYRASNIDDRHISGMGIGLYIVHEIVSLHGGRVVVESTEGQGSTFTVCLPVKDERSETMRQTATSASR